MVFAVAASVPISETSQNAPAAAMRSRRKWWWVTFFGCWTVLVAAAVWWLVASTSATENTVIRLGPGEVKSWTVRVRETVALARLNSPGALAWVLLAPYALLVGAKFSFDNARWRSRLAAL